MFTKQLKPALICFLILTVVTGLAYPALITVIAQVFFHHQANGSMITVDGKCRGSALIGQSFDDPKYFWGRLSATSPIPYNAALSSGSNFGPMNPALRQAVEARIDKLHKADPGNNMLIPIDLVTASASGLDPHISIAAAHYQLSRVARTRGIKESELSALIDSSTTGRFLGLIGEPVVNVLQLNLELDGHRK
jgi:potassium-transporting ATPase KdpC subunit